MGHSLKGQLGHAIRSGYGTEGNGGVSKAGVRAEGLDTRGFVFSSSEFRNLKDVSNQLGDYCKENFDVKFVKDIKPNMVQDFLDSKKATCTNSTLKNYESRLKTIQTLSEKRFGIKLDWKENITAPQSDLGDVKLRNIQFEPSDFQEIKATIREIDPDLKSASNRGIILTEVGGFRVSELTKLQPRDLQFDDKNKTVTVKVVDSKGGKTSVKVLSSEEIRSSFKLDQEQYQTVKEIVQGLPIDKPICKVKEDSTNKQLTRLEERIDKRKQKEYEEAKQRGENPVRPQSMRKKYKDAKTGIHAVRKMVAQRMWDEKMSSGRYRTRNEVWNEISEFLGHGKGRYELIANYITNPWLGDSIQGNK